MSLETIIGIMMCISPFMYLPQVYKASEGTHDLSLISTLSQVFFLSLYTCYYWARQDWFTVSNQIIWIVLTGIVFGFIVKDFLGRRKG
jgi:hypothetical protein